MDHDRLLHLIEQPTPDADAPRNSVLTAQIMERVRRDAVTTAQERPTPWPWLAAAATVVISIAVPAAGMLGDGGLTEAAGLFNPDLLIELTLGAVIAATVLALSLRRLS